jgi:hypothetical protein
MLHIVAKYDTINKFKFCRYFRINLGLASTLLDNNGRRIPNEKDKFLHFYNTLYKTTIYGQGNIGDIKFYTDHYIKDNTIAVYYGDNFEEFLFKFNDELVKNKGIDFFIGGIIKDVELRYEEKVKNDELRKLEPKPVGDPDMVFKNPGAVTYADVKAYLEKKAKKRYEINKNN